LTVVKDTLWGKDYCRYTICEYYETRMFFDKQSAVGIMKLCFIFNIILVTEGKRRKYRLRNSRGLVPQLLANYTAPSLPPAEDVACSPALLACAYRGGCGMALQQYHLACSSLVQGLTESCSQECQYAFIALLSTQEGARLMQCQCDDDDCRLQKRRVEPCRAEVTWNTAPGTVVSCTAATWMCMADPLCATALDYYNTNCRAMFNGRLCSRRCKNSLDILLRQKASTKLARCYCEGTEEYMCEQIKINTDVLCFGKKMSIEIEGNNIERTKASDCKRLNIENVYSIIFLNVILLAFLCENVSYA